MAVRKHAAGPLHPNAVCVLHMAIDFIRRKVPSAVYSHSYSTMSKTSAVWQRFIKMEKSWQATVCISQLDYKQGISPKNCKMTCLCFS